MPPTALFPSRFLLLLAVAAIISLGLQHASATASEATLHSFNAESHGGFPSSGLITDSAGNLYGTTGGGGTYGGGTVFEFIPNQQGGFTEQILYPFQGGTDGSIPDGGLTFDAAGNLYGATFGGGPAGGGTVFELRHNPDGSWTEKILHGFGFADQDRGYDLEAGVVFDQAGNLYGVTFAGGARSGGVVYELSPTASGEWRETVLVNFINGGGFSPPPHTPVGRLVIDANGNLFGATSAGGDGCSGGCGTIFELSPSSGGKWTRKILHNFAAGSDGAFPSGGLISDSTGNLYGVTSDGGGGTGVSCNYGCGAAYKLTPGSNGRWSESVLYGFQGNSDGTAPYYELALDNAGNLYGMTEAGGGLGTCNGGGCGTAFQLTPNGAGKWTETVLWRFSGITDGLYPSGSLCLDAAGQVIGETLYGSNAGENGTVFALTPSGGQWSFSLLSDFSNSDGNFPTAGLVADSAGNLYGTTTGAGALGFGAVFELTRSPSGSWQEKILYSFENGRQRFYLQSRSTLIIDSAGNLYGEVEIGGKYGAGMVYELSPTAGGTWIEKPLHEFKGGIDGTAPRGGLVMDRAGHLYGTTEYGGRGSFSGRLQSGNGVIFELIPQAAGAWSARVLHRFNGYPTDGANVAGTLIFDKAGNLYGTTVQGGTGPCGGIGCGVVFELAKGVDKWSENVLYSFLGSQYGQLPYSGLVLDKSGNLFGTTSEGGTNGSGANKGGASISCSKLCGTVFELSPTSGGAWVESLLFEFPDAYGGVIPIGNLTIDDAGNLYGTTSASLDYCSSGLCGTVFELSPNSSGGWNESVLYAFTDAGIDGGSPHAGVILAPNGYLYGTTYNGGIVNAGVVFEITP